MELNWLRFRSQHVTFWRTQSQSNAFVTNEAKRKQKRVYNQINSDCVISYIKSYKTVLKEKRYELKQLSGFWTIVLVIIVQVQNKWTVKQNDDNWYWVYRL